MTTPVTTDTARRAFLRSPDETLATAARDGDTGALAELRARYLRPVRAYIDYNTGYANVGRARTGQGPDVLADEVFDELADRLAGFTDGQPGAFHRWLYGVIVGAVIEHRTGTYAHDAR